MFKAIKGFLQWLDQRRRAREKEEHDREEERHFEWIARNTDPSKMLIETGGIIGDIIATIEINTGFNKLAVHKYGVDLKDKYELAIRSLTLLASVVGEADAVMESTAEAFDRGERAPKSKEIKQAG